MKYCNDHRKIGIVILHYMALDMTITCIEQLQKTFKKKAEIVIVDNASTNNSGYALKEKYINENHIHVLLNEKNEGFSRGNNIGYKYLKDNFELDYIIIANNDVLIEQDNFVEVVESLYKEYKFDVLGPDIFNPKTGVHQNPSRITALSLDDVKKSVEIYERQDNHFLYAFIKMKICDFRDKIFKLNHNCIEWKKAYSNPVLHGACYIFSKKFISNREKAFTPETFLYVEEDILYYSCKKNNYSMIYSPKLRVDHLEDVSTNNVFKSEYSKRKMKNHQMLLSYKVLLELMEEQ